MFALFLAISPALGHLAYAQDSTPDATEPVTTETVEATLAPTIEVTEEAPTEVATETEVPAEAAPETEEPTEVATEEPTEVVTDEPTEVVPEEPTEVATEPTEDTSEEGKIPAEGTDETDSQPASTPTNSSRMQPNAVSTSTVTLSVISAYDSQRSLLPADATWTVSQGGEVLFTDTFAGEHLQLPANITVSSPVPYGEYEVTIDATQPNGFHLQSTTVVVDDPQESVTILVTPNFGSWPTSNTNENNRLVNEPHVVMVESDTCGEVTLEFRNPAIGHSYTGWFEVSVDGGGATSAPHIIVPNDFMYSDLSVDYGETVTKVYAGDQVNVRSAFGPIPEQWFDWTSFEADPCPTESAVTINFDSANSGVAGELPADATWTVSQDGTELFGDTFAAEHLTLPAIIPVESLVPFGDYQVTVSAGPNFHPYTATFTVNDVTESVDIVLTPATMSNVTLEVISAYPSQGNVLPADATWTVTSVENPTLTMTDTFAAEHLQMPATIVVNSPVPYGAYDVTVSAGPDFFDFVGTFEVDEATETFDVAVTPDNGTWPAQSSNEDNAANGQGHVVQLPSETCGTVTLQFNNIDGYLAFFELRIDGEAFDGLTYGPHLVVPNDVMYDGHNVWGQNNTVAMPDWAIASGHTQTFNGDVVEVRYALGTPNTAFFDWTAFEAEPCPEVASVSIDVSSADTAIANELPADASWTVSQGGVELDSATFAAEHLTLPATIAVASGVPYGTYDVTVSAGPTFEAYSGTFEVNEVSEVFSIELTPVETATVTPTEIPTETPTEVPTETPTEVPTETATATPTETPDDGDTEEPVITTIVLDVPGGISLTGAPWSLYAPIASQVAVQPYLTGVVGPNNTIEFVNLPAGEYRLVVSPEGMEPLEFMLDIVPGEQEIVLQVDPVEEVEPTAEAGTTPAATTPASSADQSPADSSVTGLPSTGAGEQSGFGHQLTVLIALAGLVLLATGVAVKRTQE